MKKVVFLLFSLSLLVLLAPTTSNQNSSNQNLVADSVPLDVHPIQPPV
jgi:hypothetical protein